MSNIEEVRKKMESEGMILTQAEFEVIVKCARRKLEVCKKDESYLPLLLEDEIKNYFFRITVNAAGLLMMALG